MNLSKIIAINLKKLRTSRNLTLGQLAGLSNISKTMLSDIEKGNSNPSINTIWKIANGLHVPYTKLMESIDIENEFVPREAAVMQTGESIHYRVYCYFPNTPTRNFELFYVELDVHSKNATIGHSDGAQEYIYVIDGELELKTDVDCHVLHKGDAFTFDSTIGHTYINKQDTLLRAMIINYYPC